ncbi:pollen-specific leucine-rich repeat extensin-like protein 1 [Harmonia axyridis]|uniref:pollen-specific leucine-rich repeat extensin-like protein 1 n=1 Tax=Harmonia axyridis TaxID=115357 RepID=UPI001E27645D|nr:pollen-specific leucine-rich repeat extensin-like protein 1 [Harmonia axyridis]
MEDEVQLQSLAKRLINIYNACKWSKTKLHLRKKKRTYRNTEDRENYEEFTEVETEGSARTVFVYSRGNRRKIEESSDISDEESAALRKYLEDKLKRNNILLEEYWNDQSVNVCTCKKCCCDTEGQPCPRYEIVDKKQKGADIKKNSKIVICVNPTDKQQEEQKNSPKSCCCSTQQNYVPSPPVKKKSIMKASKPPNRDGLCQCCPAAEPETYAPPECPRICGSEPFCPYYAPPLPPPKPQNTTKAATCQCCPPPPRCCCSYPPTPPPPIATSCCQCSPPTPSENLCCDCSPPSSAGCCECEPPPPVNTGCCQCEPPPPAATLGCQCCPPPPCCYCDEEIDFPPEENFCCCQTQGANGQTIIHADKIIIPTCYFNEGEQGTESGNLSCAISEEVKNELLDDCSNEGTDDKQINTSCIIIRSCTSSYRRANAPPPEPEAFVPCTCPKKDVPEPKKKCPEPAPKPAEPKQKPPEPKQKPPEPKKKCPEPAPKPPEPKKPVATSSSCKRPPVCCKCQQKISTEQKTPTQRPQQPPPPQNQPPPPPPQQQQPPPQQYQPPPQQYQPPPQQHQPSPHHNSPYPVPGAPHAMAHPSAYNSIYPHGEEKMIAKHSPQPFSDHLHPPYASNYVGSPYAVGMAPPRVTDHTAPLRSQSQPGDLCPHLTPNGEGDSRIPGINENTEAEIFATLQKIEITLRDEADMHSRNMRCIVDTVCKQAGEIKELKVLVTGVVDEKKAPSCKEVEKKIKKLDKKKEKEAKKQREREMQEREKQRQEAKDKGLDVVPSNLCCKCAEKKKKRPQGCCGKCCAKRCFGCCGRCCGGCCAKCCDRCCFPCEKCCPLCCVFAKWCDFCCSCRCCRRRKKCKCSK